MTKEHTEPLLSLCIPTYNRAVILKENLSILQGQMSDIDQSDLELIVSNNCSPDNTEEIVSEYIKRGMSINYNCNAQNIGSDGNFLRCMKMAKGKYIDEIDVPSSDIEDELIDE